MSTHSKQSFYKASAFFLCALGFSYLAAFKQRELLTTFDPYPRLRLSWGQDKNDDRSPSGLASKPKRRLGEWRVKDNYVVNQSGAPVKLIGINWSGFETQHAVLGGLDREDYRKILDAIKLQGFTVIRLPFSNSMLERPVVPTSISFTSEGTPINQDLLGLTSLEVMDKVIAYSEDIGLRIILDNHRSTAGGGPQENGLWFTSDFDETSWIDDWVALTRRYRGQNAVVAFDLRNEPHTVGGLGACWGCGGVADWHLAAERAGNRILAEDPTKLIIVEGIDVYGKDVTWWGGNLEGVRRNPVTLTLPNHVVYSVHEYGPEEYAQPWFSATTTATELREMWDRRWGFIQEEGIAPVFVGEFGTSWQSLSSGDKSGSQAQWFSTFIDYLAKRPMVGWSYWSVNGEDRYAFFRDNYVAPRADSLPLRALIALRNGYPGSTLIQQSQWGDTSLSRNRSVISCSRDNPSDPCEVDHVLAFGAQTRTRDEDAIIAKNVARVTQHAEKTLKHP